MKLFSTGVWTGSCGSDTIINDQYILSREHLQADKFENIIIAKNLFEVKFIGEHLLVANMTRELDQQGVLWKEVGKVNIIRNTRQFLYLKKCQPEGAPLHKSSIILYTLSSPMDNCPICGGKTFSDKVCEGYS